jgi:RimJ/RimL family protein N-acetyltransferase
MIFIKNMDKKAAEEICKWAYSEPYYIYTLDGCEGSINELMDGSYYSVTDESDNMIGFYCFGEAAQVPAGNLYDVYKDKKYLDIGLGMKPELCGKGKGYDFVSKEIEFAKAFLSAEKLRLTVAGFNERAIKVYERVGFKKIMDFNRRDEKGTTKFIVMEM